MTPAQAQMQRQREESDRKIAAGFAVPEYTPTNQLSRRTRQARENMGEARWAEVNRQWNDPSFIADRLDREQGQ